MGSDYESTSSMKNKGAHKTFQCLNVCLRNCLCKSWYVIIISCSLFPLPSLFLSLSLSLSLSFSLFLSLSLRRGSDSEWVMGQEQAFIVWLNQTLQGTGYTKQMTDLRQDLSDGLALIHLVKAFSPESIRFIKYVFK